MIPPVRSIRRGLAAFCLLAAVTAFVAGMARADEKPAPPPAATPKPDVRKLAEWNKQALEFLKKKEYPKAIAKYEEILKAAPEDAGVLYNAACAYALSGDKPRALELLRKSVEAGFVSFLHIARDPDLESLRAEAVYKDIFARKEEYLSKASERAAKHITEYLGRNKIDASAYKTVFDGERHFVYLHAKSDEEFALVRQGLEEFADCLWRDLFDHKPEQPLYIVILNSRDCPKVMPRGVGGYFQQEANMLFCSDRPAAMLLQASVVTHEFTHGLHWADQTALDQEHPIWIKEGLSTLFESALREEGKLTPVHSYRLLVVQRAIQRGQTIPLEILMKLDQRRFVGNANLCYAHARYVLMYLREKGLLKAFYDEYVKAASFAADKTGVDAFEVVFGKPVAAVESDWKAWIMKQKTRSVPFLGVVAEEKDARLIVVNVVGKSAAAVAGVRKGDVLGSVAGTPVHTRDDLMEVVGNRAVGDTIEIHLERSGEPMDMPVKLVERPELSAQPPGTAKAATNEVSYAGFSVSEAEQGGVRVKDVDNNSRAANAGLEAGWQILKINTTDIKTVRDFLAAVKKLKPDQTADVTARKPDGTDAPVKLELWATRRIEP